MTRVVNLRHEAFDVYIGRAGRGFDGYFGNPCRIGHRCQRCKHPHPDAGSTIPCFTDYFLERVSRDAEFKARVLALKGKVLGCFCKPGPCHGDVLVAYVEMQEGSVVHCGPSNAKCACSCPDGPCEHVWDGETEEGPSQGGGYYSSTTCSRCGMSAISHSMWVGP